MERRRSLPRANTAAAAAPSPLSDHNISPLRRKSISFAPFINNSHDNDSTNSPVHHSSLPRPANSPLHRTSNASSSPSLPNRKSTTESPRRLHKQRSSDDLQTRLLWPSSKKLNPSADVEADVASEPLARHLEHDGRTDASATYNVSTFSSRQRMSYSDQSATASEDKQVERGRRSLRYHIGKLHVEQSLKKPGTPPSHSSTSIRQPPTSAPMQSGRFSFNEAALARKRSDFGVDFPSTESEQSENGTSVSQVKRPDSPARRPGSPLKGKNGGVGSFISHGFNNLFRRKSFQGSSGESVKKPMATASVGSPGRERATTVKGMISPGRETMVTARAYGSPSRGAAVAVVDGEMQHKLRLLHNYLIQWKFVNAGTVVVNKIKCDNSEVRRLGGTSLHLLSFVLFI